MSPSPSPIPLLLTFLVSLAIPTHVPLRQFRPQALLVPLSFLAIPQTVFEGQPDARSIDVSRSIVRLALAYLLYAALGAVYRTILRISGRGVPTGRLVSKLGTVLILWLMAWRAGILAFLPPSQVGRPRDVTSVIGIGAGMICAIQEVGQATKHLGLRTSSASEEKPSIISRLVHAVASTHRFLLALRIVSAAIAPTLAGPVGQSAKPMVDLPVSSI